MEVFFFFSRHICVVIDADGCQRENIVVFIGGVCVLVVKAFARERGERSWMLLSRFCFLSGILDFIVFFFLVKGLRFFCYVPALGG